MARRLTITALLGVLVLALVPNIAAADVTGDCYGEATIKGETYTPANDTPGNAIPIPDERGVQAIYSGSVEFLNTDFAGVAKVQVGPFDITLAQPWRGANEQDARSVEDHVYELDDFRDKLPIWLPGVWKVSATHSADGGNCSGFVMIALEGSPLDNVFGWIVLVGLIGTAIWLVMSAVGKHPVSAAFAALFFGGFLAPALMMWKVRPLDTLTTVILPILLALIAGVAVMLMSRSNSPT